MLLELKVVNDLIALDSEGNEVVKKRGVLTKLFINREDVYGVSEYLNNQGKVLKSMAKIHHYELGSVVVKYNYSDLKSLIFKTRENEIKGFGSK